MMFSCLPALLFGVPIHLSDLIATLHCTVCFSGGEADMLLDLLSLGSPAVLPTPPIMAASGAGLLDVDPCPKGLPFLHELALDGRHNSQRGFLQLWITSLISVVPQHWHLLLVSITFDY